MSVHPKRNISTENNVLNVSILNSLISQIRFVNFAQINKFMMSKFKAVSHALINIRYSLELNVLNVQRILTITRQLYNVNHVLWKEFMMKS